MYDEEMILQRLPLHIRTQLFIYENRDIIKVMPLFRLIANESVQMHLLKMVMYNTIHVDVCIHLTHIHLTHIHLTHIHLTHIHLTHIHLTHIHLTHIHLPHNHLPHVRIHIHIMHTL